MMKKFITETIRSALLAVLFACNPAASGCHITF